VTERAGGEVPLEMSGTYNNGLAWLRSFEEKNGRPLRVLHLGNIAANAYLNAKFLRSVGVEADVVSRDYTHVMASPEWEDVELFHGHGDDFDPVFDKRDVKDFEYPEWFISGPLPVCSEYIKLRYNSNQLIFLKYHLQKWIAAGVLKFWRIMLRLLRVKPIWAKEASHLLMLGVCHPGILLTKIWSKVIRIAVGKISPYLSSGTRDKIARVWALVPRRRKSESADYQKYIKFVQMFEECFPGRQAPKPSDIVPFMATTHMFSEMFKPYDIVQCYGTEPIHALLAEKRPYVTFEHGTLRDFTMGDNPYHQLTALAYRKADHTFITNGDCIDYADKLGITNYSAALHPINVDQHRKDYSQDVKNIRDEIGADVVLFCPARHDWDVKGTDMFIRALPLIKQRVAGRVRVLMANWGADIERSKQLLDVLKCTEDVIWKGTMCRITMIKYILASDVVFDQMVLPAFGSTVPQTLAAGVPVVSSYRPKEMAWLFPVPAPVLSAETVKDIAASVVQALQPEWRAEFQDKAREWIDNYHHSTKVIENHLKVYQDVLISTKKGGAQPALKLHTVED
tara:strand:- start:2239 stop:3939 length:1701 start_codon:yes stop_codon:yes gene_type:complete